MLIDGKEVITAEEKRLKEDRERTKYWKVSNLSLELLDLELMGIALGTVCC
jgi:hypothetical protein